MNGVETQFHQQFPQYAKTQVKVVWIPWSDRTQDWTTALSSGKNIPDITELGNTDTPTEAASGILAPLNTNLASAAMTASAPSSMRFGAPARRNQRRSPKRSGRLTSSASMAESSSKSGARLARKAARAFRICI
jgi:hypothetical protein